MNLACAAWAGQEAAAASAAAFAIKPTESLYINNVGTALHAGGRSAEAAAAYRHAVHLSPTWASPYRNLGLLEYEAGGRCSLASPLPSASSLLPSLVQHRPSLCSSSSYSFVLLRCPFY